jgi:hypothetical protein
LSKRTDGKQEREENKATHNTSSGACDTSAPPSVELASNTNTTSACAKAAHSKAFDTSREAQRGRIYGLNPALIGRSCSLFTRKSHRGVTEQAQWKTLVEHLLRIPNNTKHSQAVITDYAIESKSEIPDSDLVGYTTKSNGSEAKNSLASIPIS